jgi:paraquat-inducible protein B
MSRRASPAVIGGFVVGALVLAVVGIIIFGSGKFFANTSRAVMYFKGDIKGLQTGAMVAFQGVQIGTVADIKAVFDPQQVKAQIPVIVELHPDSIEFVGPRQEGKGLATGGAGATPARKHGHGPVFHPTRLSPGSAACGAQD